MDNATTEQTKTAEAPATAQPETTAAAPEAPATNGQAEHPQAELPEDHPRSAAADDDTFFAGFDDMLPPDMLAARTLSGDIRDFTMGQIDKALIQAGTHMDKINENAQRDIIRSVTQFGRKIARDCVRLVRSQGVPMIGVTIGKYTAVSTDKGKAIVMQLGVEWSKQNNELMGDMLGRQVAMLDIDLEDYLGEREPLEPTVAGDLKLPLTPLETKIAEAVAAGADQTTGELPAEPAPPAEHPQQEAVVDATSEAELAEHAEAFETLDAAAEEAAHRQRMADANAEAAAV